MSKKPDRSHETNADRGDAPVVGVSAILDGRLRIGLVATDPLRVVGFRLLVDGMKFGAETPLGASGAEVVPLSVPGAMGDVGLGLVMVDASCTEHLLELLATFRRTRPQVKVIVLGDRIELDYVGEVIGAGAKGYLTHTATEAEIRMALEVVSDGSVWAPRKVLSRLIDATRRGDAEDGEGEDVQLTQREVEVLRLLVTGLGNRELAAELAIDESTVKAHLSRLMRKLGVSNRIELTLRALRQNLSEFPSSSPSTVK